MIQEQNLTWPDAPGLNRTHSQSMASHDVPSIRLDGVVVGQGPSVELMATAMHLRMQETQGEAAPPLRAVVDSLNGVKEREEHILSGALNTTGDGFAVAKIDAIVGNKGRVHWYGCKRSDCTLEPLAALKRDLGEMYDQMHADVQHREQERAAHAQNPFTLCTWSRAFADHALAEMAHVVRRAAQHETRVLQHTLKHVLKPVKLMRCGLSSNAQHTRRLQLGCEMTLAVFARVFASTETGGAWRHILKHSASEHTPDGAVIKKAKTLAVLDTFAAVIKHFPDAKYYAYKGGKPHDKVCMHAACVRAQLPRARARANAIVHVVVGERPCVPLTCMHACTCRARARARVFLLAEGDGVRLHHGPARRRRRGRWAVVWLGARRRRAPCTHG